jgi:predicted DNA-binding protein (MmcQ/YjbR family)
MNVEDIRAFLLSLPYVAETTQWGDNLVFWVGDKAIGGKMFALLNLEYVRHSQVIAFATTPEHYSELLEIEGVSPAPYLARAKWVAVQSWNVLRPEQWKSELTTAHDLVYKKLPVRTKGILAMPARERQQVIADRKELLKTQQRTR